MMARDPIVGASPTSCAVEFVASLPATRLGVSDGSGLAFAAPMARFRITAGELQPRADLGQVAFHWGWRFYVVRDARILPLALDIRPGRHAGSWRPGLVTGKHLLQQLHLIGRLKADAFGGSIFTRRNFWTNFGGTPIFVSAGGVVTFSFTDLQNGDFINSGVASSMGKWSPIIQAGPRGRVSTINFQTPPVPPEAPK